MRFFTRIAAIGLLLLASASAWAQLLPRPPQGPLWEMQANGDALQKDLGFIVPKRWKGFEREGFTSTREDGASTKAHYLSDDRAIRLGLLLQFRPDVRGLDLRSESYCVVETFFPRKDLAVTAIEYTGPATDAWEARYGFAIANGRGGYYQIERLAQAEPMKSMAGEAIAKHAYLDFSNNKRASLFAVFDEWPSYEAAKQAIVALHEDPKNRKDAVITMTNPAEKVLVVTNPDRIQKVDAK
jgi:hypothetical protein